MRSRSLLVASALAATAAGLPSAADAAQPAPAAPAQATSTSTSAPDVPAPPPAPAAREKLEADIAKELGASGTSSAPAAEPAQPAGAAAQGTAATGGNPLARLLLLPDVSAIGSFALAYDRYDVATLSPRDGPYGPPEKAQPIFQELELGLQAVVDPYARADAFVSFTPDGVSVEEAYLTTLSLPAGFQVRAGTLFSPFGRQNQQHPHVRDLVDGPLAARLVADEKLSGPGLDVAWLAPLPWFAELHVAWQATAPGAGDPEEPTGVARLLQYFSLGDATTLGVGVSAARRGEGAGEFRDLGGVDGYLRWRPQARRSYLTLQGELYGRRFRGTGGGADAGGYAQLFWRQGPYYGVGVRYDDAPAVPEAGTGRERRYGVVGAWLPSEFQRLRLQLSYDDRPNGGDGLEALLALEFAIGAHGAHPF
jgi:hypothetical protein